MAVPAVVGDAGQVPIWPEPDGAHVVDGELAQIGRDGEPMGFELSHLKTKPMISIMKRTSARRSLHRFP